MIEKRSCEQVICPVLDFFVMFDAGGRRNMGNPCGAVVRKDPCQYGEEYEKD